MSQAVIDIAIYSLKTVSCINSNLNLSGIPHYCRPSWKRAWVMFCSTITCRHM